MKLLPENIQYIVIHSSHSKNPRPHHGVKLLNEVHRAHGAFNWDLKGNACYHHYVIRTDGTVEVGRSLDEPGNHTFGFNEKSISVCYMGGATRQGWPADTRTDKQKEAMRKLLDELLEKFPKAVVVTHMQLAPRRARGCPGFTIDNL